MHREDAPGDTLPDLFLAPGGRLRSVFAVWVRLGACLDCVSLALVGFLIEVVVIQSIHTLGFTHVAIHIFS